MTAWNDPPLSRRARITLNVIGWTLMLLALPIAAALFGVILDGMVRR